MSDLMISMNILEASYNARASRLPEHAADCISMLYEKLPEPGQAQERVDILCDVVRFSDPGFDMEKFASRHHQRSEL